MPDDTANTDIDDLLDSGNQWEAGVKDRFTNLTAEEAAFLRHVISRSELWNLPALLRSTWDEDTRAHLADPAARELVRLAVAQVANTGWLHDQSDMSAHGRYVSGTPTRELAFNFLLAAGYLGTEDATEEDVADVVGHLDTIIRTRYIAMEHHTPFDQGLGLAAVTALGELQATDVLWALHRDLPDSTYCHGHLLGVGRKVADHLAVPEELFAERTVPTHGLDASRTLRVGPPERRSVPWADAPYEAIIALSAEGGVTVEWIDDGKRKLTESPFRSPNGLKAKYTADSVQGVQNLAKDIAKTMEAERTRVSTLPAGGRTWPFAEWTAFYRDHPITSVAASDLVWEWETEPGHRELGLAHVGNAFRIAGGAVAQVKDGTTVRPWNPDLASNEEQQAAADLVAEYQAG